MRITHVISSPSAGGAEVYVKDMAISLAAAGHKVYVLFLSHASDVGRELGYEQLFLNDLIAAGVEFGFIGHGSRRNPLAGIINLRSHVRTWAPDVIHAHLYFGLVFAWFTAVTLVYTHHNLRLGVSPLFYRLFFNRRVSAYVGICHVCANRLRRLTNKPVILIENGVEPSRIVERDLSKSSFTTKPKVLAVGRLCRQKNIPRLLHAVALLDDVEFELLVAGEGPDLQSLIDLVSALEIGDKVTFLGNVDDVPKLMSSVDIFAMSSDFEGLPIALIEATLTGLAVIVTNVGGCAEVIHHACNGIVVDGVEVHDYAKGLRRLISSPALRKRFARNGIRNSEKYRLAQSVEKHVSLYTALQFGV